jgi:hypothetical protein
MRVTIYQPQYFPRLHYFNRLFDADVFVLLESAQYTKTVLHESSAGNQRMKSFQADTPIKSNNGERILTVNVKHEGLLPISQTKIEYMHKWQKKHLANIQMNYARANMFTTLFPEVKTLLSQQYTFLGQLNTATILWSIAKILALPRHETVNLESINNALNANKSVRLKRIVRDTELGVERPEGLQKGTEWTAAICESLGATEYLHGGTAQTMYMDLNYYKKRGIMPTVQNWKCPEYKQQFSNVGFLPNLSVLDLLLNEEVSIVKKILCSLKPKNE